MKINKKTTSRYRVEVRCEDVVELIVAKLGVPKYPLPTFKFHWPKTPEIAVVVTWEAEE